MELIIGLFFHSLPLAFIQINREGESSFLETLYWFGFRNIVESAIQGLWEKFPLGLCAEKSFICPRESVYLLI